MKLFTVDIREKAAEGRVQAEYGWQTMERNERGQQSGIANGEGKRAEA